MQNEEDKALDALNKEIDAELGVPPCQPELGKASRKPFRIHDFDTPRDKEMAVFTHAKKLSEYIFVITEKSPAKLRWNIVSRLINCSIDVIENLYMANYMRGEERITWQKKAMVSLNLLDFYTETAKTKQAISVRQMTIIVKQIADVRKLLTGWVKATKDKL